jgi:hypothetical protein
MPTKLVVPSTDKANRCLYQQLDPSNYESGARMVAFRTLHERIVSWIKTLNLYYYELMGKQNDKLVSRVDSPQTISPGQKIQSIAIDVKDTNGERQYKITCFVRSGLIQAQGNHYHKFVIKDCHALLSTMHHLSAPYLSEGHILQQLALVMSLSPEVTRKHVLKFKLLLNPSKPA